MTHNGSSYTSSSSMRSRGSTIIFNPDKRWTAGVHGLRLLRATFDAVIWCLHTETSRELEKMCGSTIICNRILVKRWFLAHNFLSACLPVCATCPFAYTCMPIWCKILTLFLAHKNSGSLCVLTDACLAREPFLDLWNSWRIRCTFVSVSNDENLYQWKNEGVWRWCEGQRRDLQAHSLCICMQKSQYGICFSSLSCNVYEVWLVFLLRQDGSLGTRSWPVCRFRRENLEISKERLGSGTFADVFRGEIKIRCVLDSQICALHVRFELQLTSDTLETHADVQ